MESRTLIDITKGLQKTIDLLERYVYRHDVPALGKASAMLAASGKMLHRLSVMEYTQEVSDKIAKGIGL